MDASASLRASATREERGTWGEEVKNMVGGGGEEDVVLLLLLLLLLLLQLLNTCLTPSTNCCTMALHPAATSSSVRHVNSCTLNN